MSVYTGPFCERCKLHEVKQEAWATNGGVTVRVKLCSLCLSLWEMFKAAVVAAAAARTLYTSGVPLPSGATYRPKPKRSAEYRRYTVRDVEDLFRAATGGTNRRTYGRPWWAEEP